MRHIKGVIMFYVCRKVRTMDGDKTEILDAPTGRWYYAGEGLGFTNKLDAEKARLQYIQATGVGGIEVKELQLEQTETVR